MRRARSVKSAHPEAGGAYEATLLAGGSRAALPRLILLLASRGDIAEYTLGREG
jgi:hypothetical protein